MAIGTISEEYDSVSEQFDWVIKPFYDRIEQYNKEHHDDIYIPGIDLTLKRKEFIRRYIPCFVEHRTPNDNRRGLDELLKRINLPFNDRFEYMCRSHGVCSSDNYYVSKRIDDVVNIYLWYEPGVKVDLDIPIESKNLDFMNEGWLEKPIYTDIPH